MKNLVSILRRSGYGSTLILYFKCLFVGLGFIIAVGGILYLLDKALNAMGFNTAISVIGIFILCPLVGLFIRASKDNSYNEEKAIKQYRENLKKVVK